MRNQNVICIIPIRSKSKSIKHKNIKMLAGFPLSVYAIKAASNCKLFKKIIIAVDNFSYKKKLQKYIFDKRVSFFKRSLNSSKDNSPTEVVISEVLKKNSKYDHSCLIQATSPLLKDDDIILGYKKLKQTSLQHSQLQVFLKFWGSKPVLQNLKLVSKPQKRIFIRWQHLIRLHSRHELLILSTTHGILSHHDCLKLGIGGEVLCAIA